MDDADLTVLKERIGRLTENISISIEDCANPEHLIRIASALECVFMSGHDDIDYDFDDEERKPDA